MRKKGGCRRTPNSAVRHRHSPTADTWVLRHIYPPPPNQIGPMGGDVLRMDGMESADHLTPRSCPALIGKIFAPPARTLIQAALVLTTMQVWP